MKYRNFRKTMFAQGDEVRLDAMVNGYRTRLCGVITSYNDTMLYVMPMAGQWFGTPDSNTDHQDVVEAQLCFRNKDVIEIRPIRVSAGGNPPINSFLPDGEY